MDGVSDADTHGGWRMRQKGATAENRCEEEKRRSVSISETPGSEGDQTENSLGSTWGWRNSLRVSFSAEKCSSTSVH